MNLDGEEESSNVEDLGDGGGGGDYSPRTSYPLRSTGGVGTVVVVLLCLYFGVDPRAILHHHSAPPPPPPAYHESHPATHEPDREREKKFISKVLHNTERTWHRILPQYRDPKLVLFNEQVQSSCGLAGSAMGPFYCGEDEKLYLDLNFFHELAGHLGAPGDFAQAYVVAHEVGHHVQKILGTLDKVHNAERRASEAERNRISVRLELQADFYAGVWAHYAKEQGILDPGDLEQGLQAASAVGDDTLQKQARGYVVPDSFTHGSSAQRVYWFRRGFDSGDLNQGDTFRARNLDRP